MLNSTHFGNEGKAVERDEVCYCKGLSKYVNMYVLNNGLE